VTQARTQLQAAQVQSTDVDIQRAMYEHAIAVLIGKPPAVFTLPPDPITVAAPTIPAIPGMLPSQLLERRPDIALIRTQHGRSQRADRHRSGAYYPTLSLSAAAGFLGTSAINWFSWPSSFFAVGPMFSQTLMIMAAGAPLPTLPSRSTTEPSRALPPDDAYRIPAG